MEPNSPLSPAPEQRLLAAIVFTDVSGFTIRMQRDESSTLKLLERDFAVMRGFSKAASGTVLKSTGDGLLLCFTSAVHAVEWALRTQRYLAAQARHRTPAEVLRHRVGVHVGDVFVSADDVMGDGVNIAARVQAEAPPGGICISSTVYEVVKNKLELDVIRLEPRKLKNIAEIAQMYHVLLEPRQPDAPAPVPVRAEPSPPQEASAGRPQKLALIASLLVGMGLVGAGLIQAHFEHKQELNTSQAAQAALSALLTNRNRPADGSVAEPAPLDGGPGARGFTARHEVDFAKLAADPASGVPATPEAERALRAAQESLQTLNAWLTVALQRYTPERPLDVRELHAAPVRSWTVYTDSDRQLYFVEGGASRRRDWQDLRTAIQGAIVVSALRDSPAPPPPGVIRGAEAFAYVHRLPEMAVALLRERHSGGGPRR